jgi:hypothetical protein
MALPGYAIAGDYRYGALCALIVAAALIAYATPSRASFLAAAVLLFTPRIFFVLEQGWTESFALALLAAVVFVARRAPRWLFVPVGLFLASKQYLPLTAPLLLVLLPRPLRLREVARLFVRAAAVGLVVTLPFILWAPGAFARSALTLHSPFRLDALSFLAWYGHAVGRPGPDWASLLVLTILSAVALWRCPRTVSGYAGGVAVVLLGCFLVARHAFCNHYFLVIGALCAAVASARAEGGVGPAPAAETVAPVSARPPEP